MRVDAIGFTLHLPADFASAPARARVTVDGAVPSIAFDFRTEADFAREVERRVVVLPLMRDAEEFGKAAIRAKQVGLDLFDAKGAPMARYTWDLTRSERIAELLLLTRWSCTSRDR